MLFRSKPDRKFGEDLRPKDAKKPLITLPPFLEEIAELPKRTYLVTNIAVFGIFGLLPVFEASFVSSSIGLNFGIAMFRLYNRGAPDTGNDEDMAMRPVNKRASFLTFGICGLATALGASFLDVAAERRQAKLAKAKPAPKEPVSVAPAAAAKA